MFEFGNETKSRLEFCRVLPLLATDMLSRPSAARGNHMQSGSLLMALCDPAVCLSPVDAIGCTLRYTKWERPDECFSPVS